MATRREFLAKSAVAATMVSMAQTGATPVDKGKKRRLEYLGWQVGITYQNPSPGGVDRDYMLRLLDKMAAHKMNLLSLMMLSYGYYDPGHDGYAWPVQHEKLRPYRDPNALNAKAKSEFLRAIIAAAADRHIEVQLFLNWGIWNPKKVASAYPSAALQVDRAGKPAGWLHCPDAPGAWQFGLDEAADLLAFYNHPNVTGYSFERISYGGRSTCYCPYTRKAFADTTGSSMDEAPPEQLEAWKIEQVSAYLKEYIAKVKQVRPGLSIGLHTQCSPGWGHDPKRLPACGIDFLLPHTIQFRQTRKQVHAMLERLAPNPCVLHFCTRDRRPANYALWIKTPEIITQALDWAGDYRGDNLAGILFFNEPATSPRNKNAVYEGLARLRS